MSAKGKRDSEQRFAENMKKNYFNGNSQNLLGGDFFARRKWKRNDPRLKVRDRKCRKATASYAEK